MQSATDTTESGTCPDGANTASLRDIIDHDTYPIDSTRLRERCKHELDSEGVLVLPNFLIAEAVEALVREGKDNHQLAYFTVGDHTAYLAPIDPAYPDEHPRNRQVTSSKGCITTDQIPDTSSLRRLHDSDRLKSFLCAVLDEEALHPYADPLSSINLHYASHGQELGWHFDNSSFAITLLIQQPEAGGEFEYVKDVRDADAGDMNFETVGRILDANFPVQKLQMSAGTLVLFRGRNSIHRVTPTVGDTTRMLVVLAYNTEPNIALSESARLTFYGRLD